MKQARSSNFTLPSWQKKVKYPTLFYGYCFACNNFGHKAINCRSKMFPRRNFDRSRVAQDSNTLHANGNNSFAPLMNEIECFR